MLDNIQQTIINNHFVNEVRVNMNFNNDEYNELVSSLEDLANHMKNKKIIDKELTLYLYTIPQMIRNAYANFDKWENKPELALRLKDAWIELDSLVINCLS